MQFETTVFITWNYVESYYTINFLSLLPVFDHNLITLVVSNLAVLTLFAITYLHSYVFVNKITQSLATRLRYETRFKISGRSYIKLALNFGL